MITSQGLSVPGVSVMNVLLKLLACFFSIVVNAERAKDQQPPWLTQEGNISSCGRLQRLVRLLTCDS
jgi:hypothetical protein